MSRRRVLAVTTSPLPYGDGITDGPGFRMWNLLWELRRHHDVRIISLYESFHEGRRGLSPVTEDGFVIERLHHAPRTAARRIRDLDPDVLYLPWSTTPFVYGANKEIPTVLDYVGPGLLEAYVGSGTVPLPLLRVKLDSFWSGDLYLTSSSRERFYLLGLLAASGRLSVGDLRREDPLVHVVRMTPPAKPPPVPTPRRGGREDKLIVMVPGAFLPWYNYSLLKDALERLSDDVRRSIRVVLLGGNRCVPEAEETVRATFSRSSLGRMVEFTGIVPFRRRLEYYLGADVALSLGPRTVEDELSSRTRIIDCLWARLPVLTSGQDEYSTLLLEEGAGLPFEPTPDSLGEALTAIERNRSRLEKLRERMEGLLAHTFNPQIALRPLLEFLENPQVTERRPRGSRTLAEVALWARDLARALRKGTL